MNTTRYLVTRDGSSVAHESISDETAARRDVERRDTREQGTPTGGYHWLKGYNGWQHPERSDGRIVRWSLRKVYGVI